MKYNYFIILTIILIISINRCEKNPNHFIKDDKTSFLTYYYTIEDLDFQKKIAWDIVNVLDSTKIFRKTINLDTTVYSNNFYIEGIDGGHAYDFGIVYAINKNEQKNIGCGIGNLHINKANHTTDTIQVGAYTVFFISNDPISEPRLHVSVKIYNKNGNTEICGFYIENPEQYRITLEEASFITKSVNILPYPNKNKVNSMIITSKISDETLLDNYDIFHINVYNFKKFEKNETITRQYCNIVTPKYYDEEMQKFKNKFGSTIDMDIDTYTFIFQK